MPATQHTRNGTWILPTNAFSGCHKGAKSHGSCRKTMSVSSTLLTAMQHELLPRYIPKETDISLPPDEVLGRACEGYVLPWATLELARPRGWATFPPIKSRRAENAAIWLAKRRAPVVLGGRGHAGPIGMREAEAPSSHWLKGSSRSRSGGGGGGALPLSFSKLFLFTKRNTIPCKKHEIPPRHGTGREQPKLEGEPRARREKRREKNHRSGGGGADGRRRTSLLRETLFVWSGHVSCLEA